MKIINPTSILRLPNIINQATPGNGNNSVSAVLSGSGAGILTPGQSNAAGNARAFFQMLQLSQYNAIGQGNIPNVPQQATSITYTLDNNGGGTPKKYFIAGNSTIATLFNGGSAMAAPDSSSDGSAGDFINNAIKAGGVINFLSCIYTAGTGQGVIQFNQDFLHLSGDFDGTVKSTKIIPAIAENPANNNADQLKFIASWEITQNNALVITVYTGYTVSLALTFNFKSSY